MSYQGYRLSINEQNIPNSLIAMGSYSCTRERRLKSSWIDANGIEHLNFYPTDKTTIQFNLRERNGNEQESLAWLFANRNNIMVNYWDDMTSTYKSGLFYMENPKFAHRTLNAALGGIMYDITTIRLVEY